MPLTMRIPSPTLSSTLRIIKVLLSVIPQRWKPHMYDALARALPYFRDRLRALRSIFRLPFGLVLKISNSGGRNEADALRFVGGLSGVHCPQLIDFVVSQKACYLLTTWVDGDCVGAIWDDLTESDKAGIADDLQDQFEAMRSQTMSSNNHLICNVSGGPVDDPRVPWIADEGPRTFSSSKTFAEEVWIGLDWEINRNTLRPILRPIIERDVAIVFSHGDLLPKNIILPGGLDCWRAGASRICIIDWEYAGWMPIYWDALKAAWMSQQNDDDDGWYEIAQAIFPECRDVLDADWRWRSESRVTIV